MRLVSKLLAISYMVVNVTAHTSKLSYSDTLTLLKRPAAAAESVFLQEPLLSGSYSGSNLYGRQHLVEP